MKSQNGVSSILVVGPKLEDAAAKALGKFLEKYVGLGTGKINHLSKGLMDLMGLRKVLAKTSASTVILFETDPEALKVATALAITTFGGMVVPILLYRPRIGGRVVMGNGKHAVKPIYDKWTWSWLEVGDYDQPYLGMVCRQVPQGLLPVQLPAPNGSGPTVPKRAYWDPALGVWWAPQNNYRFVFWHGAPPAVANAIVAVAN